MYGARPVSRQASPPRTPRTAAPFQITRRPRWCPMDGRHGQLLAETAALECRQFGITNSDDSLRAMNSCARPTQLDPELSAESSDSTPESRLSLELVAGDLAARLPVPKLARARLGHRQSGHARPAPVVQGRSLPRSCSSVLAQQPRQRADRDEHARHRAAAVQVVVVG